MIEWFASLFRGFFSELTFLGICVACAIVTGFSLLFGGDSDGDADHGDVATDSDHDDGGHEGPKFFSIRGICLFGTGFGGVGYLVQHFTKKTLVASVSGLGAGILMAILGIMFIRLFYRQQASSLISSSQLIGSTGTVITSIPESGGVCEVILTVAGMQQNMTATSATGHGIESGAYVKVIRSAGARVIVEKVL